MFHREGAEGAARLCYHARLRVGRYIWRGRRPTPFCPYEPARPMRVLLLQQESNLHIDLVALDVAILDQDVLVLNPRALHTPERRSGTGYGLVDGVLEAGLRGSAQLRDSGNTHGIRLLTL